MLRRICFPLVLMLSLFTVCMQVSAAEINSTTYDVYVGDVNGDSYGSDYYFLQKPLFVLLFGDVSTPLFIQGRANFAVYRNGTIYDKPIEFSLTNDQLSAKINSGQLKRAQLSVDFFIWPGISGNNILLRGADLSAPSILIGTSASTFPPNLIKVYGAETGMGNRNYTLGIVDVNGDSKYDILVGSSTAATGQTAYLADGTGIPSKQFIVTPATTVPSVPNSAVNIVGSTAGQFRVDESGSATYSVPISLPDGVAGVTPQIALAYSSQAGSGILGKGWSLSGLSAISRCHKTLGQDGVAQPINWSSSDRFCLNGQRLILTSGTYGVVNSIYKTEIDSFTSVTLLNDGANTYFIAQAKDGSTSTFGRTADSRVVGSANAALTWSINRFEDNAKNAIDYVYEGDSSTGQAIRFIRYAFPTPNVAATPISRSDYKAEIQFTNVTTRSDPSAVYVAGYAFAQKYLLTNIKVVNKGNELRTYKLSYMDSSTAGSRYQNMISRLETIQECRSTYCLPPLSFTWGGGSHVAFATTATQQVNFSDTSEGKYVLNNLFADVTGDGKTDLIYLMYDAYKGSSSYPYKAQLSIHINYALNSIESVVALGTVDNYNAVRIINLDYNADGRQDLAVYNGASWKIYISTPRAGGSWIIDASSTVVTTGITDVNTRYVDINGDGLADAVSTNSYRLLVRNTAQSVGSSIFYKFDTETQFFWGDDVAFVGAYDPNATFGATNLSNCVYDRLKKSIIPSSIADFNGDGVADFVANIVRVFKCNIPGYTPKQDVDGPSYKFAVTTDNLSATSKKLSAFQNSATPLLPDVNEDNLYPQDLNGDGLTDFVYAAGGNIISYRLNTGNGFETAIAWQQLPIYSTEPTRVKPQFLDYNGDGKIDIIWFDRDASTLYAHLFGATEVATLNQTSYSGPKISNLLMDISGDGIVDFLKITSSNMYVYNGTMAVSGAPIPCHNISIPAAPWVDCVGAQPNPSVPVPANQQNGEIVSISNGLGNITNINYGTLSNSGRYSTTNVNLSVTQQPTGNPYCSGGVTNMYCPELTYTVTDSSSFYSRLNGGWDLPGGSTTLVTGNETKGAPVLEVNGAMQIVTSIESSAPKAGATPSNVTQSAMSKISYYYGEAKMQASGRGFLGFNKLKTVDEQTGVVTATTFRQDFPFVGSPLATSVFSNGTSSAKLLSRSSNTWDVVSFTGIDGTKYFQTKLKTAVDESFDLSSGTLLQTTTTDNQFDNFGNPTQIIFTASGKKPNGDTTTLTKTTVNTYGSSGVADYYNIYGRLTNTSVTTVRDADPSVVRTSSFSYYGDGESGGAKGLLKKENIEPAKTFGNAKEYQYDQFGNKYKVFATAINSIGASETRTVTNAYSNDGRDLISTTNDLNQKAQVLSRNEYGDPTNAIDINSVGSQSFYDGFGHEYMKKDDTGAWIRTEDKYCGGAVSCPTGAKFITEKSAAGGSFSVEYFDILGRTIRTSKQGFDGRMVNTDTEYDNLSRIKRQSLPYYNGSTPAGWIENEYDILGRVVKITQPDGSYSSSTYDGYTTTLTNALSQTRKEIRNGLGQLIQVVDNKQGTDNLNGRIDYEYDPYGNLEKATTTADGKSVSVRICYDTLGRKVAMFDPDKGGFLGNGTSTCARVTVSKLSGWWHYTYDGFGELITQLDTKKQNVKMVYDKLGRMVARTDLTASGSIEGFTQWFYEKGVDGSTAPIQGKLTAVVMNTDPALTITQINDAISSGLASCNENSVSCHKTINNFDIFSRPLDTTVYYPGSSRGYISRVGYDILGRGNKQYDAMDRILTNGTLLDSGVRTSYNDYGYADKIFDIGSGELLQQTLEVNERGQVTRELRGNGVTSSNVYDNLTGQLTDQQSGMGSLFSVQNIHYKWDSIGNLKYRDNQTPFKSGGGETKNLKESFCYDSLNRLTKTVSGVALANPNCSGTQDITYDGLGNIASKVGVGTYSYGSNAGPHAVTAVTGDDTVYTYDNNGNQIGGVGRTTDNNGNQIGGAGRTITYTTYDQANLITRNGETVTFSYGPSRERWQRTDSKNNIKKTTIYLGNVERIEQSDSTFIEWKRYVGGAIYTYKTNTANQIQTGGVNKSFVYNDHLGSLDVITDGTGVIRQSLSFDPWGARRGGENWATFFGPDIALSGFTQSITKHGFTGHEMVDGVGLIHMNGRIYDPRLARFLQADPFIQAATNTQSYNRYSYALNNPLNATDPSGFMWGLLKKAIRGAVKIFGADFVNLVGSAFFSWVGGPIGSAWWSYNFTRAMGGTSSQAFMAGFSAGITSGMGGLKGSNWTTFAVNAVLGGSLAYLQGGNFGNGFWSAGLSSLAGGIGGGGNYNFQGMLASAIVGGTISELTGGKFKNGAQTAAMSYAMQWATSKFSAGGKQEEPESGKSKTCNPINISTGEKYLTMTDYHAEGASQMSFERYYSSYAQEKSSLGFGWRSNFDRKLQLDSVGEVMTHIAAIRHQGDSLKFDWVSDEGSSKNGKWVSANNHYEIIRKTKDGWELQLTDDTIESYDKSGRLLSIKQLNGYEQKLIYGNQGTVKNVLLSVTDNFAQRLTFKYDLQSRISSMTATDGAVTHYEYDSKDNLVKITSPDDTPNNPWDNPYKVYDYNDSRFAHAITGIRTSEGKRIHSMAYDDQGRAILSALGDDAERVNMVFSQGDNNTKQTLVRNSLGKTTSYTFDSQNKPLYVEGNPTATCIGSNQNYEYNDQGQLISKTDWNGVATRFEYNERGLEASRTESAGTLDERRVLTQWHDQWRLPIQVTTSNLVVNFTYNEKGLLISRVERDLKAELTKWQQVFKQYPGREWSYVYNEQNLLVKVDGPRTDAKDITQFEYDAKGNRTAVINALGHRSEVLEIDERGLPLKIRDANGVITVLTYNVRGWLTSKTIKSDVGDNTTQYHYTGESDYTNKGLIDVVTLPNGQEIHYEYDAARRVIAQRNNLGDRITYKLDLEGNRLEQTILGADGELMNSQQQVFDELSRLLQSIGADGSVIHFGYDKAGNRVSTTDALNNKTAYAYDALNRLIATTDAAGGVVEQTYNQADQVTSIKDQRGLTTQYRYNGFGNKVAQISPDTGETLFAYNEAGNLVSKKDARGVEVQYHYDVLGRVLEVVYPGANESNIYYSYDTKQQTNKGVGRLTSARDPSGQQTYTYNSLGEVAEQIYKIDSTMYSVTYDYDAAGQIKTLHYPSGRIVSYEYDQGRVKNLATINKGSEQILIDRINYLPFGPLASFTYGNGQQLNFTHDQNYRLRDIRVSNAANDSIYDRHYDYDATSNIVAITDRKAKTRSQTFNYDALHRLTAATGSYGQTNYHYDSVGNRTEREQNGRLEAYTYSDNSNRLLSVISEDEHGELKTRTLSYDSVGNITKDAVADGAVKLLSYGENNRLQKVDVASKQTADYEHNAKGQRVIKRVNGKVIHFHYDVADQLIAETDASGLPIREYIYGAGQRIALVDYTSNKSGVVYYIVNDHLGTPQLLLDNNQQVAWSVDQSPFGEVKTEGGVDQPLRFPGQYADAETGYSYNYFRDYDPSLGRYIESDPIGLEGGVNTFGYVGGKPVGIADPYGLDPHIVFYRETPPWSKYYTSTRGVTFVMPSWGSFETVYSAGQATGQLSTPFKQLQINRDTGHFGTFDFQRETLSPDEFFFIGDYTDASNYGVGVYMNGAGYSLDETLSIAGGFAKAFSSNSGASAQKSMWQAGWEDAKNGDIKGINFCPMVAP